MLLRDARNHIAFALSATTCWLGAADALAQSAPSSEPSAATSSAPRPEDVQAAGRAFQEAQSAQLRGDVAQAAELYDLAHRSAPSAAAMRSSIRMHQAAGHAARAANLSRDALTLYASDAATVALAQEVLAALEPSLGQVSVTCAPACTLAVDGRAVGSGVAEQRNLFVDVGAHLVQASWETQVVEQHIDAVAQTPSTLTLTRPALPPAPVQEPEPEVALPEPITPHVPPPVVDDSSTGLSPAFFITSAGLTLVSAGLAAGFGIDMLSAQSAYRAAPTEAGWRDGVQREIRTNAFIGTSIGLAALTLGLAFLTDWDGTPSTQAARLRPRFFGSVSPEGAYGALTFSF